MTVQISRLANDNTKKALENLVTAEKLLEKANIRVLISDPYVGRKALLGLSKQDEALAEFQRMLDLAAVEELFDKLGTHLRGLRPYFDSFHYFH